MTSMFVRLTMTGWPEAVRSMRTGKGADRLMAFLRDGHFAVGKLLVEALESFPLFGDGRFNGGRAVDAMENSLNGHRNLTL